MNRDSLANRTGATAPAAGGSKLFRLLLATGAILLAASALTLCLASNHLSPPRPALGNPSRPSPQPAPTLEATPASLDLCPRSPSRVQLNVLNLGRMAGSLSYKWHADAGRIADVNRSSTSWNLSRLGPGTYTATVTITRTTPSVAAPILTSTTKTATVTVSECRIEQARCPDFSVTCKDKVVEGEPLSFTAILRGGGTRRGDVTTKWSLSASEIINTRGGINGDRGSQTIFVRTNGMGGRSITATFTIFGYGRDCSAPCETTVSPSPTPTPNGGEPTPPVGGVTPPPTSSVTPTPSLTPTPGLSASPSTSPASSTSTTTNASSTPSSSVSSAATGDWLARNLWLVLLIAALCVGAFLLAQKYVFPLLAGTGKESPDPEGLGAILVGGQKKVADELQCSVFAPFAAAPGDSFLVQAFAHLAEQATQLAGIAKEADRNASRRGAKGLGEIERGQELSFHLQMPGLEIDEPSQSFVWRGEIEAVQFGVTVPETFKPHSINCKLTVSHHSIPLGHVKFTFDISDAPRTESDDDDLKSFPNYVRYRRAFISYASEDRAEVLRRVQMLSLLKVQFFQDVLSLEPGARWEKSLYRYIDRSDVFFLFWSKAAYKSEWVEKEVQYALQRKGGNDDSPPEIVPVILQGPPEAPPPSYLPEYHFNDPFAFFIRAETATQRDEKNG